MLREGFRCRPSLWEVIPGSVVSWRVEQGRGMPVQRVWKGDGGLLWRTGVHMSVGMHTRLWRTHCREVRVCTAVHQELRSAPRGFWPDPSQDSKKNPGGKGKRKRKGVGRGRKREREKVEAKIIHMGTVTFGVGWAKPASAMALSNKVRKGRRALCFFKWTQFPFPSMNYI